MRHWEVFPILLELIERRKMNFLTFFNAINRKTLGQTKWNGISTGIYSL